MLYAYEWFTVAQKTIVFLWLSHFYCSISQSQQIRATEAFHLLETVGSLLFVRRWEVVFQTQDYAHCDLSKHNVLAIFSWNRMKATLKRRMLLIRLCQGNRRHIWERVISDSIMVPKIPDCRALKWKGSNSRDLCVICKKELYQTDLRCQSL